MGEGLPPHPQSWGWGRDPRLGGQHCPCPAPPPFMVGGGVGGGYTWGARRRHWEGLHKGCTWGAGVCGGQQVGPYVGRGVPHAWLQSGGGGLLPFPVQTRQGTAVLPSAWVRSLPL